MKEIEDFENILGSLFDIGECPSFSDEMRNNAQSLHYYIKKEIKKLKECPFCGGEAILDDNGDGYYWVKCGTCECVMDGKNNKQEAIKEWNTRIKVVKKTIKKHTEELIIPAKTEEIDIVVCDICGQKTKGRKCMICGKDICEKHKEHEFNFGSDYPDYYCTTCFSFYVEYKEKESVLEAKHEKEFDSLYKSWKQKSLSMKEL